MRRTLMTAVATAALAMPGAALAHGDAHRAAAAHHRRGHHRHARIVTFRAARAANPTTPSPATTPTAPTTPSSSSEETVGTIASYTNETLTITLNDGTTVSGKVTERTEIECEAPTTASAADFGRGDDGQNDGPGPEGASSSGGDGERSGDGPGDGSHCPGHGEGSQGEGSHCTTAALVVGAKVAEAELSLSGAGAVWEKVEL